MRKLSALLFLLLASPALAQSLPGGDSNAPIEINADRLEVVQPEQKAIFSGNVEATQGKIKLNSDRMTVFYRPAGEGGGQSGVSRIEVAGNVKMNTPTEFASGDRGVYNVDNKQILVFGNVLLRRDKNVLNGDRLEYNLQTGRSLLTSGDTGAPVGATTGATSGGGRVKGVFIPKAKE
jgi:lipopolysaccharide export system protein LptA